MESPLPFIQQNLEDGSFLRTFKKDVVLEELQWHWDERDRWITVLQETDWQIQMDNELPRGLARGERVFIEAGRWHRVLRGTDDLKVLVKEL